MLLAGLGNIPCSRPQHRGSSASNIGYRLHRPATLLAGRDYKKPLDAGKD